MTSTVHPLPIALYLLEFDKSFVKLSGRVCALSHSIGVKGLHIKDHGSIRKGILFPPVPIFARRVGSLS